MHIVIIGNGISGITAARFIRKQSEHRITVISKESDYFFSRTALMYIYMGHMRLRDTQPYEPYFFEKNRIELLRAEVQAVDFEGKSLTLGTGKPLKYDKLILATGSASNKFGWPGQDLEGVQGLYSLQDLESMEAKSQGLKRAVVVGGGLIGIEMAEMFASRQIPVTMMVREASFWNNVLPPEESEMINRHIREHHIDLRLATELDSIQDDGNGNVASVKTKSGESIDCGFVGLTVGVHPNIGFLKNSALETQKGIVVNEFLETNIQGVYAIGDCAQLQTPKEGRRPVEAIWYTGRMMGETVAKTVCGQKTAYDPGIWFNSAKFFDIEYQVYGDIQANLPDDQATLYWENHCGKKSVRLQYDSASGTIRGFNLMGIRYRHEVCEKWIKDGTHIEDVLQNLGMANFDPEFYREYEAEIVAKYNAQTGKSLSLKKKRGLAAALSFLEKV